MQEPYLGEVRLFAFNFAPVGWAPCQGQLLAISQSYALFQVLGTSYGGDGKSTFGLPDYRGVAPTGLQYCISLQGLFPQGPNGSQVIGELATLPYSSFAPESWLNCAGQLLPRADYEMLFQILGTRFGGDGETTFGLPNLTATPPPPSPAAPGGSSLYFISAFGTFGSPGALLGTVQLQAFGAAPRGWIACEGQLLPIVQHQALFSLLGTTFGGDGKTTFGLPNLRQVAVPAGTQYCICVSAAPPRSAQGPGEAGEGGLLTPQD